ncbi:hypothetical protein ACJJTC_019626 [Scirpophaga incertulas]
MGKHILILLVTICHLAVALADTECGENEIYADCTATCNPEDCSELGFPKSCPSDGSCPTGPGCICRGGYLRDSEGNCVDAGQCPSCGGDPNATVGCGTNCRKKCEDLRSRPTRCPLGCSLYGCDCKDGFFYDRFKKRCVKPSECRFI